MESFGKSLRLFIYIVRYKHCLFIHKGVDTLQTYTLHFALENL